MRLVALSTSTRSFCSKGRYRALMVTAPYFSELVSSWKVGYKDKGAVLHPHHGGDAQGLAEAEQEFWGTQGMLESSGMQLSPLLLNAVAKPAPTAPRTGRKFHISTGRACEHGWDVGRGWEHHPDSYLLLDPVAEVFLDEFAAGGGAEGQVSLQRLWGG